MMNNYKIGAGGSTIRTTEQGSDIEIANFNVRLTKVVNYVSSNSKKTKFYSLDFYNPEFCASTEVESVNLEKFDYSTVDDSLLLNPLVSTASKELACYIKSQTKQAESIDIILFNRLGWHNVSGQNVYCAGDTIIGGNIRNYSISNDLSTQYKFEYDDKMSEQDCVREMFKIMNIEPHISSIVFITGIVGVLRQLFIDADIKIPCILYVFGNTQFRKTTLVIFSTALYGRSNLQNLSGISTLRVSSTEFKSEECVDSLKDATFVFDDLFKENNTKLRKDYEKRVRNIIRNFADNSPRMTARSSFENNCQVIITAEYLLNTKTDIGRLMLLELEKPINSERLSICQRQPLAVSSFYYHFIKWISPRYSDIVDNLKAEFKAFRMAAKSHSFGYERLYEYTFLLEYAFNLFLDYAIEIGCQITDKKTLQDHFFKYINDAIAKQKAIIETLETREIENINFSQELLSMLNDGIIKYGEKGSPCFRKGNDIYITNEIFGRCLRQKFNRDFSSKEITAYFRNRYISKTYADNRLKKYNGKCYLILNVSELIKDAKDDSIAISNLFFE